jgi:hypothetical protein
MRLLIFSSSILMLCFSVENSHAQTQHLFTIPKIWNGSVAPIHGTVVHNDSLVLYYNGSNGGPNGLFRSNGTLSGTYKLIDAYDPILHLGEINGKRYYVLLGSGFAGDEIYVVNEAGTSVELLVNLIPFSNGLFHGGTVMKSRATKYNNKLYFMGAPPPHEGGRLIETDGTADGTKALLSVPYVESSGGTFRTFPLFVFNDTFYSMRRNHPSLEFIRLDVGNQAWESIDTFDLNRFNVLDYYQLDDKVYLIMGNFLDLKFFVFNLDSKTIEDVNIAPGVISRPSNYDINFERFEWPLFYNSSFGLLFSYEIKDKWGLYYIDHDGKIESINDTFDVTVKTLRRDTPRGFYEKDGSVYFLAFKEDDVEEYGALYSWNPQDGVSEVKRFKSLAYAPYEYFIQPYGDCLLLPAALDHQGKELGYELWKYCPGDDTWDIIWIDSVNVALPHGHMPSHMVRLEDATGAESFVFIARKGGFERIYVYRDQQVSVLQPDLDQPGLTMYPNPAGEVLYLSVGGNEGFLESVPYEIVDPLGRIVRTGWLPSAQTEIPLSGMPAGIYYLLLHSPAGLSGGKFIKQ